MMVTTHDFHMSRRSVLIGLNAILGLGNPAIFCQAMT